MINLLGPVDARRAGHLVTLPPRRRSLLTLLALRAGGVVTAEHLADGLWGEEAPPTAVRTLHAHIAKLGSVLGEHEGRRVIQRRDPGYILNADAVHVDRDRFEDLVTIGQKSSAEGRFAESARSFDAGLRLWRGEALSGCRVYGWAAAEAGYLEELRLQAFEGLFAASLAAGVYDTVVGKVERLVAEYPLRERLWELLIVALQVTGRSGDALMTYQRARRTIVDELGIEPGEGLRHVEACVLEGATEPRSLLRLAAPTRTGPSAPEPATLPQEMSTLIGRKTDIAETAAVLNTARLVTLTGFGGSGKTRLAVAVARAVAADFAEVVFVDLAATGDKDAVGDAIASALGIRREPGARSLDQLARRVSQARVLMVLDNCERLVGECADIAQVLLTRCSHLKILGTSQEALRLPGEVVRAVSGLGLPDPDLVRTAADLVGYDAVTLFCERAEIGDVAALSPVDARAVAAICAKCDGSPLAIELAATRARLLTLPEIAYRMRDPYSVLTNGPRGSRPQHRALRATVEWSYNLLGAEERSALRRFSVFGGAFTLEAVAAVHPDPSVLETVGRLVDKSLLKPLFTLSGMRYRLLRTIRRYALEQLTARPGEHTQARRAHATHYLRCAEETERRLQGPELGDLVKELAEHHDDMREAVNWLIGDDPESALRLAAALWRYHHLRGRYAEGRDWLRTALAASATGMSRRVLAKAYWSASRLAVLECDYQEAEALAASALETYEAEHDDDGAARSLALLGEISRELGDDGRAIELGRRSLAVAERGGDEWAAGHALRSLGFASWLRGDFAGAALLSSKAARLFDRLGDSERLAWCRLDLGAVAFYTGDLGAASYHLGLALSAFLEMDFDEGIAWAENLLALVDLRLGRQDAALGRLATSLRLHHELGDRWRAAVVLGALARAVAVFGEGEFAAELLGAAEHIRQEIGTPVPSCERAAYEETRALIRGMVTASAYQVAVSYGVGLDIERLWQRITGLLSPVASGTR
ncbi:BTAD domain-containing putative transcriptional regulator [Rhizohabitans arisaemae]|uniref:BTAD domain-containing putative transcriptional regulator n=1 Tax=Rhizohabitans arisaemae TaxID=2720610 RepID=UPI0024B1BF22|nr:BTAD domain-containing putative transcriptional regulator [Rhizohabitans arisaemae]